MKNQIEMIELFHTLAPQLYIRFGKMPYRIVSEEMFIVTMIGDQVETRNTAQPGDYLLLGPKGEVYVQQSFQVLKNYDLIGKEVGIGIAKPNPRLAVVYSGEPFQFTAPWGAAMSIERGDYLVGLFVQNPDVTEITVTEVYRVGKESFEETYKHYIHGS
jgi:hypothetical protein